ncbi:MAG: hypothetical protein ACOY3E_00260 [Pseudomonadota bacterium]
MLREAWLWVRTPCAPAARRLGHLAEAIALSARTRRQQRNWQSHHQHTRQAILQVAAQCEQRQLALILGAGECHDVPVAELAQHFERVVLVDIVLLPALRRRCKAFLNVECHELDLTGLAASIARPEAIRSAEDLPLLNADAAAQSALTRLLHQLRCASGQISFVASVNLLSQLPVKPIDYLQQQMPSLPLSALNAFAWQLLRAHVQQLQTFRCPVCLITDDRQRTWNAAGEVVEEVALVAPLALESRVFARWHWPLAPKGELAHGCHAEHEVVAIRL